MSNYPSHGGRSSAIEPSTSIRAASAFGRNPRLLVSLLLIAVALLAKSAPAAAWSNQIGGTLSGLVVGSGSVVLQNNGHDNLSLSNNGSFHFATPLGDNQYYSVTVYSAPAGQSCSVVNGSGKAYRANVTNIQVNCSVNSFPVGGTLSGLLGSGPVVLQNNGGGNLSLSANGSFSFAGNVLNGGAYLVTVFSAPAGQNCIVTNASGTVSGAAVNNVQVSCTPVTYQIGGALSGLTGSGPVVVQNNGGDNLTLNGNGTFTFPTAVASGNGYAVTVLSAPVGQYCAVTNGSGTVAAADVADVQVSCAPSKTYTYSGKGFKLFQCATSPNPNCAAPGAGNPYLTVSSITATLTLATPLEANLPPTDVSGRAGFRLSLNDSQNTLNLVGPPCNGCASAWVTTNANGEITSWYLEANSSASSFRQVAQAQSQSASSSSNANQNLFTVYDPSGAIAGACNNCYANYASGNEQDYGQFAPASGTPPLFYAYNVNSHGSFSPGYPGGSVIAADCVDNVNLPCQIVPGNTFAIRGPNATAVFANAIITQQLCVVPADPRGANCGAVNGNRPRSLNVSDLPQCKGFGNEVIPDYMCGASGASGTGFGLILGNAEQLDTLNGTYGDSELDVEKVPGLAGGATNPTCPKGLPGTPPTLPSALAAVATRSGSLVEEQTPEQTLDGRPLLIEMTSSCDPPKSNHGPGLTIEGIGFKLRTEDPAKIDGLTRMQRLLLFANYKFLNLDAVLLLTKFPTNTPTRKNLQACINKSQTLLNKGPANYFCAAEQIYRCERIVEPGTDFHEFGPTTGPLLRLPDPYGDAVRRLGNLFYTINTRINGQQPNVDWPLPASAGHPDGDPYPNLGCP